VLASDHDFVLQTWRTPVVATLREARANLAQLLREAESVRDNDDSYKILLTYLIKYYKRRGIYYYKELPQ
jgi:hypothetical protein